MSRAGNEVESTCCRSLSMPELQKHILSIASYLCREINARCSALVCPPYGPGSNPDYDDADHELGQRLLPLSTCKPSPARRALEVDAGCTCTGSEAGQAAIGAPSGVAPTSLPAL